MLAHEKLAAYQHAIEFVAWSQPIIEEIPGRVSARDQLDRASTSVPLNIAEGNGKFSTKDRARYLQTAFGSALECAAILDVLFARKMIEEALVQEGKNILEKTIAPIMGLLNHFGYRVDEEQAVYGINLKSFEGDEDEDKEGE